MKRVGFVGLGTMGIQMARNILNAGYELFVYNRTAPKAIPLVNGGAVVCPSPADVGEKSEIVIVCVSDAPDVESVIMGEEGVSSRMAPNGIIVDCSTSSPQLAKTMAQVLKDKGIGILDAPVSGGPEGAKKGTLAIMVGGEEPVFQQALPILETMGKTITLVGPPGAGQLAKAINQIIAAMNLQAVAEGIALAKKSGIDAEKAFQAISGGAAKSWILEMRGPLMLKEQFTPPNFTIALHAKDLRLAIEAAEASGAQLEIARQIKTIFQSLVERGYGEKDHSGVYLYTKELNEM